IREVLARGEIVGFIIDQARPGEPRLPFFSKPAKTNTSLAAIWCRARAPIVPVFIHRQSFGHHIIECQPELVLQETASSADDIIHNSLIFNRVVETAVRRYPEHYFWFHNRWK
ncbi:MAG: lysophospholipid acyltransferase family protein, partial [Proteobacteria bacterium]|nr:lysophospholipid acyltransferase family protein [Pseudomonadota bacterium]